ncbi:MAG: DNA polymerase III subunit delta [Bacteroidales bacterium]|jgi:DNA polymerase-3 subunit delta|nr:DNA polymerase III subunit delta [Bacteroidales bacterium]
MTYDQITGDLRRKIYHPVYLLHGEEPYFIDAITEIIEESVLTESEREFNQTIVYGRDTDPGRIIDIARRFPMMANYQVVIVKEAQDIDKLENLKPYVEKPVPTTILVIAHKHKKLDLRKGLHKIVEKTGVLFESKKLYDDKIPAWINGQVQANGYTIKPDACQLLAEYLGADLGRIINELEKLVISLPAGTAIDSALIERNIGISKDYNFIELQNAIGNRDIHKANRIVNHFTANLKQNPTIALVAILYGFFIKLMIYHQLKDKSQKNASSVMGINPFFYKDYEKAAKNYNFRRIRPIIALLREYDLRLKGVNNGSTEEAGLLRELVYKIMH